MVELFPPQLCLANALALRRQRNSRSRFFLGQKVVKRILRGAVVPSCLASHSPTEGLRLLGDEHNEEGRSCAACSQRTRPNQEAQRPLLAGAHQRELQDFDALKHEREAEQIRVTICITPAVPIPS